MTDPTMTKTVALLPELDLREQVARAISIPEHHTGWDFLTARRQSLYRMQADYALAAIEATRTETDQQLREEVERLREAIKPFAQLFDLRWAQYPVAPDNAPISLGFALHGKKRSGDLELSDFRRARSSLSSSSLTNG